MSVSIYESLVNSDSNSLRMFAMTYPSLAGKVESWVRNDRYYIFTLNDGRLIEYDFVENCHRPVLSPEEKRNRDGMQWRREFSFKLRRRLKDTRTTQMTLSIKTGISERIISRYVNGSSIPSAYNLEKIANALDCDMDDLV